MRGVLCRRGRARKEEPSGSPITVDLTADQIPGLGEPLPLVHEDRRGALDQPLWGRLQDRSLSRIVEAPDRLGPLQRCLRLADGLRPLDGDCSDGRDQLVELRVDDSAGVST